MYAYRNAEISPGFRSRDGEPCHEAAKPFPFFYCSTRGIPTVYGCGVECGGVHGANEWVDLASVGAVKEVYPLTLLRFCRDELWL
jgi:acetylornithine deacetylase/succinyl-diaminopimelate desuccinylase-like protein